MENVETIVAISTAVGPGGIGVVRLSGVGLEHYAVAVTRGLLPQARRAVHRTFFDQSGEMIDDGITLYFPAPGSYTGEDVLEFQGHGGTAVLQMILQHCLLLGARMAQPGEFTLRAFLNHKLDLVQAEAVADLITAQTSAAVRGASRSLCGEFSKKINVLNTEVMTIRVLIEACNDFPEEGEDFLRRVQPQQTIEGIRFQVEAMLSASQQGMILRTGRQVVLIGAPNVGKSSLLNALTEEDFALVTDLPGTTRDPVRSQIVLGGVPIHLIDTAGIRISTDPIEQAGIKKTWEMIAQSDLVLVIVDARVGLTPLDQEWLSQLDQSIPKLFLANKVDLLSSETIHELQSVIPLSARTGEGLELLKKTILESFGFNAAVETPIYARERHLAALKTALPHLNAALDHVKIWELMAEDLRLAQKAISEITGEFSSEHLLGKIFSTFCIGK